MNIDGKRDFPSETTRHLTPTLHHFQNFKNDIPQTEIIPIIEVSSQRRKNLLELELKTGKLIANKKDFLAWVELLKKNNIIDIKTSLEQINADQSPIIIQTNEQKESFNYPFVVFYKHPDEKKGRNGRLGFIDNSGSFISNITKRDTIQAERSLMSSYKPSQETLPIIPVPIAEKKPDIQPVQKVEIPKNPDVPYQIKKGDYLWKIISEQYDLHPQKDKNTVWQIMESIKNNPKNAGLIKKDAKTGEEILYIGDIMHLPTNISIKKGKKKEDIKIKNIETK